MCARVFVFEHMGSKLEPVVVCAAGKSCRGDACCAAVLQETAGCWAEASHKNTWAEAFLGLASAQQPIRL
jgi:hypothetical protein